jgi:hypothetical protein
MITDIFARRYQTAFWFPEAAAAQLQPLFMQAAHLIFTDLQSALAPDDTLYKGVHDRLARELGLPGLPVEGENYYRRCAAFLAQPYNLWNDYHGDVDTHTKRRFSILEMLFAAFEERTKASADTQPARPSRGIFGRSAEQTASPEIAARWRQAFAQAVAELNQRLHIGRTGLAYHNGVLQRSADELTEERIVGPFWEFVAGRGWSTVDGDMKEACDRADRLESEAANYAMRALESAIKLVSENAGASTGKERGAANYIDNLVSERAGRLLQGWEGEALKALFRDVRNPLSHGGGAVASEPLTAAQTTWVIEVCMSWIKRLARPSGPGLSS